MQRTHGDVGGAREVLRARDGSILLDEPDEPIGERHLLRPCRQKASEESLHLGAYRLEVAVGRRAWCPASCRLHRHDAVHELAHGNARERREAGWCELRPEDIAAARELSDEA